MNHGKRIKGGLLRVLLEVKSRLPRCASDCTISVMFCRGINTIVCLQLFLLIQFATCQNYQDTAESKAKSTDKWQQPTKQKTCEDGMKMVHHYLETSKIELLQSIRAEKSAQCNRQGWKKVDKAMVAHSHSHGVKFQLNNDESLGLRITAKAIDNDCRESSKGSSLTVHIKGGWKQIMFTQVFKGSCKCWRIFGATEKGDTTNSGLEQFSRSMGDLIFGQKKMKSSKENIFDGTDAACGGFWGPQNGHGERQATVVLRRRERIKDAGLYTRTFCGNPEYVIKDIYVLM